MTNKVKCLYGEKGLVRMIPEKWANDFNYMRKHNLHKVDVPVMEPIIVETKHTILDLNEPLKEVFFEPEVIEDLTKEQLFEMLTNKGIEFKKTYGVDKLKQLLNQ